MGLTDSGLCLEAVWGLFFQQSWLPELGWCCPSWLPAPQVGNRHPHSSKTGCVAMPWLLFTAEPIGLTHWWRKACAKRPGCELALSLRHRACQDMLTLTGHSGGNALHCFSCLVYLVKAIWALSLCMLVKVCVLHLHALSRDPLLQLQLMSGAAIQMLMRNPRLFCFTWKCQESWTQFAVLQLFGGGRAI